MSTKNKIEQLKNLDESSSSSLNESYTQYKKTNAALRRNIEEFPRGSNPNFSSTDKFVSDLLVANTILLEVNTKVNLKAKTSRVFDETIDKEYEINAKKRQEILSPIEHHKFPLGATITLGILFLLFAAAYVVLKFLNLIKIENELLALIIPIAAVSLAGVFFAIFAIILILFFVRHANETQKIDEEISQIEEFSKNINDFVNELHTRELNQSQCLKEIIALEEESYKKIGEISDNGAVLTSLITSIGDVVYLISTKQAQNFSSAISIVERRKQHNEIKRLLLENKKSLDVIIKELNINNKIAIASFSDTNLELDD